MELCSRALVRPCFVLSLRTPPYSSVSRPRPSFWTKLCSGFLSNVDPGLNSTCAQPLQSLDFGRLALTSTGMDADEARKALDLARKHDMNGNTEAALKWARKSVAIYSTPEAMALFTRLKEKGASGNASASSPAPEKTGTAEPAPAGSTTFTSRTTHAAGTNASGQKVEYTEKQVEIVRRVRRAGGDFYAVLDIEKSADEGQVRKSYKKVCSMSYRLSYTSWRFSCILTKTVRLALMRHSNVRLLLFTNVSGFEGLYDIVGQGQARHV